MQNFLFYDPAAGEGEFYRSDGLGGISLLKRYSGWRSNWTHIIPGMFGGNPPPSLRPSFLFYDGAGTGEFYTADATGGIDLIRTYTGWQSAGKPWTHIIPGAFSAHYHGYDDLLFYDSAGTGAFYTVGGQAEIVPLKTHTGWQSAADLGRISFQVGSVVLTEPTFYSTRVQEREHSTKSMGKARLICLGHTRVGSQTADLGRISFHLLVLKMGAALLCFFSTTVLELANSTQ
jgi:hypothetical protein